MHEFLKMPIQASSHAAEIDQMTVLVHWLMLVMFVGWGLFFIFVLFRFRKGAHPVASYTGAKGKISKGTEVAVALIEVVLLIFYAIPAWAKRVKAFPSESEAVVVRIVAEQFAWNIHYPGPDGRFGLGGSDGRTHGNSRFSALVGRRCLNVYQASSGLHVSRSRSFRQCRPERTDQCRVGAVVCAFRRQFGRAEPDPRPRHDGSVGGPAAG